MFEDVANEVDLLAANMNLTADSFEGKGLSTAQMVVLIENEEKIQIGSCALGGRLNDYGLTKVISESGQHPISMQPANSGEIAHIGAGRSSRRPLIMYKALWQTSKSEFGTLIVGSDGLAQADIDSESDEVTYAYKNDDAVHAAIRLD